MINATLTSSHVPADFKHAIVKPLLKKPTLDKDILNNYRPVSNLPFISKLVERVVAKQLTFDCNLRMEQQIANVVKVCYYQIRNIGRIRPHLTNESCKTLVHALVTSRLDYCNSLLYGIPNNTMQRMQRVQNCAARIITRTKKYDHITPVLQRLHWLPVHLRPTYKVLLLTYCALNGVAPDYLSELFNYRHINRTLRSASQPPLGSYACPQTSLGAAQALPSD